MKFGEFSANFGTLQSCRVPKTPLESRSELQTTGTRRESWIKTNKQGFVEKNAPSESIYHCALCCKLAT